MKLDNISTSAIDFSDETFFYNFHPSESDQLTASIKAVGLLNPIILIKKENQESFRLVHGFKRVKVAQKLKIEKIFARIYNESELSKIDFFNLSLYENAGHRQFNAIEQGIIIDKLIRQFQIPLSRIEQVYLPLIGLGSNPKVIERYQSLINLELPLKNAIADDFVGVDLALKLAELPEQERSFFLNFCLTLKAGKNRQKEFYNLFADLTHIAKNSFIEIAQNLRLENLLTDDSVETPVKSERIRLLLRQARFPNLTKTEQEFKSILKEMKIPSVIKIIPFPFFEESKFTVTFDFQNRQELKKQIDALTKVFNNPAIEKLENLT
jgi:hypothetical protein